LDQLEAQLRAELLHTVQSNYGSSNINNESNDTNITPTHITILINALIAEYLEFHNYKSSLSVFLAESHQSNRNEFSSIENTLGFNKRSEVAQQLNIIETNESETVPLLYTMTALLQHSTHSKTHSPIISNNNQKQNQNSLENSVAKSIYFRK